MDMDAGGTGTAWIFYHKFRISSWRRAKKCRTGRRKRGKIMNRPLCGTRKGAKN